MATHPGPTDIGLPWGYEARADWMEAADKRHPLKLVPAIVEPLSFALADVAAEAVGHIFRARSIIRGKEGAGGVAEAIGIDIDREIITSVDVAEITDRLESVARLPLTLEFDPEIPVLRVASGREIVTFLVVAVELGEGPLIGRMRGVVRSPAFLSVLIAFSVPSIGNIAGNDAGRAARQHRTIERAIAGSPCRSQLQFHIDASEIRGLAAAQLDWKHPPDGDKEEIVICRLQYVLILTGLYPGPIDGVRGELTNAALKRFMVKYGLQGYQPNSEMVLGQLALAASAVRLGDPG